MNRRVFLFVCIPGFLALLAACSSVTTSALKPQPTVTINPSFQSQISPIPTMPTYACGAWASNNAPGPGSMITIYAKLTKDIKGVSGATASAVVHFQSGDVSLPGQQSDSGGYVSFPLPLEGRQPVNVPATVTVTFSNVPGYTGTLQCTAFFTPM
ncbi:MAG TPA: hypothetical protein VKV40_09070 [Ktedonobacteraceae bacterium]|nr:hypothetical protein [Ktedonobacteraceae bacterium]